MLDINHLMSNIYLFEFLATPKSIQFESADGMHEGGTTVSHEEIAILQHNLKELLSLLNAQLDTQT